MEHQGIKQRRAGRGWGAVGLLALAISCGDDVSGYGTDGAELWTQVFAGPGAGSDVARGVAIDDGDAAIVVGTVLTGGGIPNLRVVRLTADGVVLGTTDYGGVSVLGAEGYAVAVAPDQDVVFAGCEFDPDDVGNGDIMVAKVGP